MIRNAGWIAAMLLLGLLSAPLMARAQVQVRPPTENERHLGQILYSVKIPEAIRKAAPIYPDSARSAGVAGTVMVQALVGQDGRVKGTRVVKSIPLLDAAAVECVKQCIFKPALTAGKPVAVWVAIPVKFSSELSRPTPPEDRGSDARQIARLRKSRRFAQ